MFYRREFKNLCKSSFFVEPERYSTFDGGIDVAIVRAAIALCRIVTLVIFLSMVRLWVKYWFEKLSTIGKS
uniref:Uncharacterized protein n=1 Tax=Desertifilum tharense IPPAS B-1220 TaxID=1781255 RepID=A0A1E5QFR0_9CYAN|nr:hypothetical protein BH720_21770 [Desertifilum tharense IPPAS B-1220]